jgi:hypothetical protein
LRARVIAVASLVLLLDASVARGQANRGGLRLRIVDPSGAPVRASIELTCPGDGYDRKIVSDGAGSLDLDQLHYGLYRIAVRQPEFALYVSDVEIRSAIPVERSIHLMLASTHTDVEVIAADTLIDPASASSAQQIGERQIDDRLSSLPGRSVQDLVISQPGWLYEGNAVLHPRGSEYQTQFVVDGIPFIDNRSPSFGPEIEADDLQSMTIYTGGFPAEYGRKMGGVVELDTDRPADAGLHGELVSAGGSFDTASGYAEVQDGNQRNILAATASGSSTAHYLNPVVPEDYTNTGTTGDFSGTFAHNLRSGDRLDVHLRHELSRFLIPNELPQQQAGQRQNGDNFESLGTAKYQHILTAESLFTIAVMGRENDNDLYSNVNPTPIAAFQHNSFREAYFKATYALDRGAHDFKAGVESDNLFLHENFSYAITDPAQFDPGTPPTLSFNEHRPDLEQSAFVEDNLHARGWTIDLGVRWDHYQLLLNRSAVSPRIAIGRYLLASRTVLHGSWDRIFQTPSFENILISSSAQTSALSSQFLRLPVQPSTGNDYELGATQAVAKKLRIDVNAYRRDATNYADDDQLLNTGVSYPIAFRKAVIYGAEGKLQLADVGKLSGFLSYSYMVGNAWFPVTGGLFLADDAAAALSQLSGHFPDSQDQRNTLATRFEYKLGKRAWLASGVEYGSGLPFDYGGTEANALAEYGPAVVSRLNFARGRIRPLLALNSSVAVNLPVFERVNTTLHVDGNNLNNRLNVLDFGGLFSGNAIDAGRSVLVRWEARF